MQISGISSATTPAAGWAITPVQSKTAISASFSPARQSTPAATFTSSASAKTSTTPAADPLTTSAHASAPASPAAAPAAKPSSSRPARSSSSLAQVQSAEAATLAGSYSTTVNGTSYSGSVEESGGTYTASIPNLPGATASGSSLQAAENDLNIRIDILA